MMANEEIDYKLVAEQLRTGKPLFGKDSALAPMLERILNAAREGREERKIRSIQTRLGTRSLSGLMCPKRGGHGAGYIFSHSCAKNDLFACKYRNFI